MTKELREFAEIIVGAFGTRNESELTSLGYAALLLANDYLARNPRLKGEDPEMDSEHKSQAPSLSNVIHQDEKVFTGIMFNHKPSGWKCHIFGGGKHSSCIELHPQEGDVPNWFWRTMQFLAFGNRWEKVDKPHDHHI